MSRAGRRRDARGRAGAPLRIPADCSGDLRVLDVEALADWADRHDVVLRLEIRPGQFVFPSSVVGQVSPAAARASAEAVLRRAVALGDTRSVEQDLDYAVR